MKTFDLNEQQQMAVSYISGPVLVLAGAGSGKTRVITEKIAYLIEKCNIHPSKICAVTFTNKAAKEMEHRVTKLLDGKPRGLSVSTFHTFGLKFLHKEYKHFNIKSNISIFDTEDSYNLLKDLYVADEVDVKEKINAVQMQISLFKGKNITPKQALATAKTAEDLQIANLYVHYQKKLQLFNAVDFDDLIYLPLQLLSNNQEVLEKWQNKVQYLLIDEYQDTNQTQYELIKLIAGVKALITAVGDDHQSIYAWRGANPENLQQLAVDYPTLKVIKLEQNYRSMGNILNAANNIIKNNNNIFEKNLWSNLGVGDRVRIIGCASEQDEASRVVSEIILHTFQNNSQYKDFAVLYRNNHQSRLIEQHLREHKLPYTVSGGTSFFSRSEVKDILAYLKLLVNPDDDMALLRIINVPKRGIGTTTIEKLSEYATMRKICLMAAIFEIGLSQYLSEQQVLKLQNFANWINLMADNADRSDTIAIVKDIVTKIDYENWLIEISPSPSIAKSKIDNVTELLAWLERLVTKDEASEVDDSLSLSGAVNKMLLIDMLSRQEQDSADNCVQLTTLHAAKGLEFPHVFIIGMEEEVLPHKTSIEADNIDEERRLAYVGVTRAQRSLTCTMVRQRKKYSEVVDCKPSRFLLEIPSDITISEGLATSAPLSHEEKIQKGKGAIGSLRAMLGDKICSD